MRKFFISAMGMFSITAIAQTGNLGINAEKPEATLDIKVTSANASNNTNQGLLIPRLSKERVAKITDANLKTGTLVYVNDITGTATNPKVSQITSTGFYHYSGTNWVKGVGDVPNGTTTGQVLKWNGTAWVADADTDTNTTYTAGMGIKITNTTIATDTPSRKASGNVSLSVADHNGYVYVSSGTVTIPANLPKNFSCIIVQEGDGAGLVNIVGANTISVETARGTKTRKKHSAVGVFMKETNVAILTGDAIY